MQRQKISEAEFHMLRTPQQGQIKPGDLVYTTWFELSQVVASEDLTVTQLFEVPMEIFACGNPPT